MLRDSARQKVLTTKITDRNISARGKLRRQRLDEVQVVQQLKGLKKLPFIILPRIISKIFFFLYRNFLVLIELSNYRLSTFDEIHVPKIEEKHEVDSAFMLLKDCFNHQNERFYAIACEASVGVNLIG